MKPKFAVAGLSLACAACCAPLLIPLLAGSGAAALVGALTLDSVLCGGVAVAALAAFAYWTLRARRSRAARVCGCEGACETGGACGPGASPAVR